MQIQLWLASSSLSSVLFLLLACVGVFDGPRTNVVWAQQEPIFELPVQLVGFPVIILAVRLTNFVKKLQYSLSPDTYKSRNRRDAPLELEAPFNISKEAVDISIAEKQILQELGPKACVMDEPCRIHAGRMEKAGSPPDWNNILRDYKAQQNGMKQWYLLSVFLGDVIRDVHLCKQLSKRLSCDREIKPFIRD